MAWEWVSPVSGAVVGLAGLFGGYWISRDNGNRTERMAKIEREASRVTAHETWIRERRAEAYVQVLELAESIGGWIAKTFPTFGPATTGDPPDPDGVPGDKEQVPVIAKLRAYGSRTVQDAHTAWLAAAWSAAYAVADVIAGKEDARQDLHRLRVTEQQLRKVLADSVNAELGPESRPSVS